MYSLAIDIGGTFIKYAIIDEENKIIKKWKKESIKFDTKDQFYNYLCQDIKTSSINFIGVSAPGIIDKQSNVLSRAADNICIMYKTNINEEIEKRLSKPTWTINDAKAAGLCEFKMGNSQKTSSSAYLLIGTGVGGCIYYGGTSLQGYNCLAGELSFLPFSIKEGKIISLSHYASMPALVDLYNQRNDTNQLTYGHEVCSLYLQGHIQAVQAVEEWCQNIVFVLNTLVICYDPEIICIGGGISEEDWFIKKVKGLFIQSQSTRIQHLIKTRIDRCAFHNDANLLGAVLYAKSKKR